MVVFFAVELVEEVVGDYSEALSGFFDQVVAAGPLVTFVALPLALWCLAGAPEHGERRGRLVAGASAFTLLWMLYLNTWSQSRFDDSWGDGLGTGLFLQWLALMMGAIALLTVASAGRWWERTWQALRGRLAG